MLRITVDHNPDTLVFRLEGRLVGPWVPELRECWENNLASRGSSAVRVDLRGVTFLDAGGKELLAAMHARGAELIAGCCLMKAVVAEITHSPTQ